VTAGTWLCVICVISGSFFEIESTYRFLHNESQFVFPFVLSLSKHEELSPFDKLRANGRFSFC